MKACSSDAHKRKATAAKDRLSLRKERFKTLVQLAAESHLFKTAPAVNDTPLEAETTSLVDIGRYTPDDLSGESLLDILQSVMQMETMSEQAACRVAHEYYRLGREYVKYISTKEDSPPPVHSQSFHRVALPHLALITKALTGSMLTHAALLKRLERARKVWLLTSLFGNGILTAKAVANISFLDTVPFTVFGTLATSATEAQFVADIKKLYA